MSVTVLQPPVPPPEVPARLSREQYYRMVEAGIWDHHVPELIDGYLVERMPASSPLHTFILEQFVDLLTGLLIAASLDKAWYVRSEKAIDEDTRTTMPDVAVVRGSRFDYIAANPTPADVALVAEVAISTQAKDAARAPGYGQSDIATFLLIDGSRRTVTRFAQPTQEGYAVREEVATIDVMLDGACIGTISASDLFPPVA